MAKQIEGVYENVLRCARQEFLEKGFALASLRDKKVRFTQVVDKENMADAVWTVLG